MFMLRRLRATASPIALSESRRIAYIDARTFYISLERVPQSDFPKNRLSSNMLYVVRNSAGERVVIYGDLQLAFDHARENGLHLLQTN